MNELRRLARSLRIAPCGPRQTFVHRVATGLLVAALILIVLLVE